MEIKIEIYTDDLITTALYLREDREWSRLAGMVDAFDHIEGAEDIRKALNEIYFASCDNALDEVLAELKEKGLWRC